MALCTWVHYNTFVKMATVSVPKLLYMYKLMTPAEQKEFLAIITGEGKRRVQNIVERGYGEYRE